jgi:hypothetical protein
VANALSALGVQPRELPLTPTRIWELVQAARQGIAKQWEIVSRASAARP